MIKGLVEFVSDRVGVVFNGIATGFGLIGWRRNNDSVAFIFVDPTFIGALKAALSAAMAADVVKSLFKSSDWLSIQFSSFRDDVRKLWWP